MPSKLAGGALRTLSTLLYFLEFCCAAIALGIFSYFLAKLSYHDLPIATRWRAVEGLTGSAVLYTIFAVLLTCFLGGMRAFGFLAVLLDLLFCGAMIAVAVLTRHGASSCSGTVNTPLGVGPTTGTSAATHRAGTSNKLACKLNTAVFAVSIIAAFLFLLSAIFQVFMVRHHQKEKKFGPSPKNGYTSGSGKRKFWQKKQRPTKDVYGDSELAAVPIATNGRHSHDTGYTGTTVPNDTYAPPTTKYETSHGAGHYGTADTGYENHHGGTGAVHSGPGPTAASNPYGYTNHPTGTAVNY